MRYQEHLSACQYNRFGGVYIPVSALAQVSILNQFLILHFIQLDGAIIKQDL
jgi:hypothetical protein